MRHFGLVGHPVGHSWSAEMHNRWFNERGIDASYDIIDLKSIEGFRELMKTYSGVNITIPYKREVIGMIDRVDEVASAVGAVNTVIWENGELVGYNTDIDGFRVLARGLDEKHVLVLGDGGASKAVQYVLREMNCETKVMTHSEIDRGPVKVGGFEVVVNATPVGMSPECDKCVKIDVSGITDDMVGIDLVYNPKETVFLSHFALRRGGFEMLTEQGRKAFELFIKTIK
ncbi:MAG: shikimate dehydrogenase [Paludibacteraceae bacterium]|nr:shikimate dehydrogenase [Paludibacteraceae bacterium]